MQDINKLKMDIIKKVVNITDEEKLLAIKKNIDAPKEEQPLDKEKQVRRFRPCVCYEGFGLKCGLYTWSTISGVSVVTLDKYIKEGLSIEDIFTKKQIAPPTEEQKNKVKEDFKPTKKPAQIPRESAPGIWEQPEGFGRRYTCRQWAIISGIHPNSFRRYIKNGMTVEEIFEYRHCDPPEWTE